MINYNKPIIVLAGPTASGKSSMAIQLAKDIDGYVINADSRQVYQELKIGTAQPIPDETQDDHWIIDNIPHYLYGHVSAKDYYNIFQYQKDVQEVLDNNPNKTPILVGGTGLYIDSIVYNYNLTPNDGNTDCKYSREELNTMSLAQLQEIVDKDILEQMNESDRNNPVRLIRIIEKGDTSPKQGEPLNSIYFVIDKEIDELKDRMSKRIDYMINNGLIEENQKLLRNDFNYDMQSMRSIGYREFKEYFENDRDISDVKREILTHTLQYAKRQRTWFKRNINAIWTHSYEDIKSKVQNFLATE